MNGFAGDGFVAAMIGRSADAEAAVALAGGRVGERLAWGECPAEPAAVLVVEAEGIDEATLAAALPAVADWAAARGVPVVAAFAPERIDVVAAALLDAGAVLLCAPTLAERVAALAVAGGPPPAAGLVREDDGERLRRISAEVGRIAALLAALVEPRGAGGEGVGDRRTRYAPPPVVAEAIDPAEVRKAIRARRLRGQFFDARLLEDPGWDMLLDLFAAELEGMRVSVSSLCIAAAVPPTTALRWITRMADAGLLVRLPDAGDRRRAFLVLGADASDAMRRYVAAVRQAGLPIA